MNDFLEPKLILPPFNRQGSKTFIRKSIIEKIPEHDFYVEPFFGSGSIFFNKKLSKQNIINDLDKDLIQRLELLKECPPDTNLFNNTLKSLDLLKEFFDKNPKDTIQDKILFEKIKTSCGYGNAIKLSKQIYNNNNPSTNFIKNLHIYKNKLNNAILLNQDYKSIINNYNFEKSFFFFDPPYEKTNKIFYTHSKFDFKKFKIVIDTIKGKFLLTLNNSVFIKDLFKDYFIKEVDVLNPWNHFKTTRKELFISNYLI